MLDLTKYETWERIAAALDSPHHYDLSDSSHKLDVVQIVCQAIDRLLAEDDQ